MIGSTVAAIALAVTASVSPIAAQPTVVDNRPGARYWTHHSLHINHVNHRYQREMRHYWRWGTYSRSMMDYPYLMNRMEDEIRRSKWRP